MAQRVSVVEAAVHLRTSVDGVLERIATGALSCQEDGDGRLWVVLPDPETVPNPVPPRPAAVITGPPAKPCADDTGEAFRNQLKDLHARHLLEMADLQARHQAEREHAWDAYRLEKERLIAANRPTGTGTARSADGPISRLEGKS